MKTTTVVKPKSKVDWLKVKEGGIGASEAPSAIGINPWQSPYELWLEKTGKAPPKETNEPMQIGTRVEDGISLLFQDNTGHRVIKVSAENIIYRHPNHPFVLCTPDRRVQLKDRGGKGLLECKNTRMYIDGDDDNTFPRTWFTQLQYQIGIIRLTHKVERSFLAWLSMGSSFGFKEYSFNKKFFDFLVEKVDEFWNEYVQKDIPPPATTSKDVELMYKDITGGSYKVADDEIVLAHDKLMLLGKQEKEIKTQINEYKEQIKLFMLDNESVKYDDQLLFTWKKSKTTSKFNEGAFKQAHLELYEQYLFDKEGTRRFIVK